jgi:hypothetical protein
MNKKATGIVDRILNHPEKKSLMRKYTTEKLVWIYTKPDKKLANEVMQIFESRSNGSG